MSWRNNQERYGSLSIGLHWIMLILLIAVYACIELRVLFPKGSDPREMLKTWHYLLGFAVLILAIVRLGVRLTSPTPRIQPSPPAWQRLMSTLMHYILYALMIGMPILGWLLLSAEGKTLSFFGLELPALIMEDKALGKDLKHYHALAGSIGYVLIVLHAGFALIHHVGRGDNTLTRMGWPKNNTTPSHEQS